MSNNPLSASSSAEDRAAYWARILASNPELLSTLTPRLTPYIPVTPTAPQATFLLRPEMEVLYGGAAGGGKAQPLSAVVMTPFGPTTMGQLKVGSLVSNPDGSVSKVIQIHPQGLKDIYKVSFSDGSSTQVTAEHLWEVNMAGTSSPSRIADTAWLKQYLDRQKKSSRPYWPLIPLSKPVEFNPPPGRWHHETRPVDPYVLGVLLGDGCLRNETVTLASADTELVSEVKSLSSYDIVHAGPHQWRFKGNKMLELRQQLKDLEVYGHLAATKFVPQSYKIAPINVRQSVLQGLMDTDGYVDKRGHCHFYSVSQQLALDVQWIARSLGGKATITTKPGHYRNDDGEIVECQLCYCVYIQTKNNPELFRLSRKRLRCSTSFNGGVSELQRRMVSIELCGQAEAQCITVSSPNGLYLTDDFIVTHNSIAMLMAALQYVDIPGYSALLLRKSLKDLALPNALMDIAFKWLNKTDAKWDYDNKTWRFPSTATLTFGYLDSEGDKDRYQGSAYNFIGFDELTQFEEQVYTWLISRLRQPIGLGLPLRVRAASNPGGVGHNWVKRRFLIEGSTATPPRVFIPAKVADNPYLDRAQYELALSQLDPITRAQLLDGSWDVAELGEFFRRTWFKFVASSPNIRYVRFWDLSAQTDTNKESDWTVGAKVGIDQSDPLFPKIFIADIARMRGSPGAVEEFVRAKAEEDGRSVHIYIEQEGGSSGVAVVENYKKRVLNGFPCDGAKPKGDKQSRARVWSAHVQAGNCYLQLAPWNEEFIQECEVFPTKKVHDDQVDAVSGAVTQLLLAPQPKARFIDLYHGIHNPQTGASAFKKLSPEEEERQIKMRRALRPPRLSKWD